MSDAPETARGKVRVWDGPTRLFHWSLAVLFGLMWWSAETNRIDLHIALGLTLLGLLSFRLIWGVIGGSTARFANFVKGPPAILAYLRGQGGPASGHNPVGAISVVLMLVLLATQVGLGLFASDEDGFDGGPLSHLVTQETGERLLENHETLFNVLLVVIALHIAAIVYYFLARSDDLVTPMLSGRRDADPAVPPLRPAPLWRLLVAVPLAAAFPLWLALG